MTRTPLVISLLSVTALSFACGETEKPAPVVIEKPIVRKAAVTPIAPVAKIEAPIVDERPAEPRTLYDEEAIITDGEVDEFRTAARALLDEEKPGEAIDAYRKALFLEVSDTSWAELGRAYLRAGEEGRGLACLEEAVKKNRFLFTDRVEMAKRYLDQGEMEKAKGHAEIVALNRVDDVEANYLAGRIFMKMNMWSEAVASFEKVVQLEPDNKFARNNLGFSALQVGDDALALRHLEETLDLEPTHYMLNNLGIAYERMTQEIDAFASFARAVEVKPGYVNAIVNRDRVGKSLTDEEKQLAMDIVEEFKTPRVPTAVATADDEHTLGE